MTCDPSPTYSRFTLNRRPLLAGTATPVAAGITGGGDESAVDGADAVGTLFERSSTHGNDDVATFADVPTVHFQVDPRIEGGATTGAAGQFNSSPGTETEHVVDPEHGDWRFVP